jgi:hypothetical protein
MGKKKAPKRNQSKEKKDSSVYPFHGIATAALTAGVYNFVVSPSAMSNIIPRVLVEADTWAHFRMNSFRFRILRTGTVASVLAYGYAGGVQDSPPGTIGQIGELLSSSVLAGTNTVPGDWVRVSKTELAGPLPWYKTIPGTADPTEEAPGVVIVAGTGTEGFCIEVMGVIEFKIALSTINTPEAVFLRDRLRLLTKQEHQKKQLQALNVLAGSQTNVAPTGSIPRYVGYPGGMGGAGSDGQALRQ